MALLLSGFAGALHPPLLAQEAPTPAADWTLEGASWAKGLGDINHDGFDDVVVDRLAFGWPGARAEIYLGSRRGLRSTPAWSVEGEEVRSGFPGQVTSAGDVNGDGFTDILAAAPRKRSTGGRGVTGKVYLFLGSATKPKTTPAWTLSEIPSCSLLGHSLSPAGDVNGDGYDDVLIGSALQHKLYGGIVSLFYGSPNGLAKIPDWTLSVEDRLSRFGWGLAAAGDVNGDGYDDILIGAPWLEASKVKGHAFLVFGSAKGPSPNLEDALQFQPPASVPPQREFVSSVAGAGDVNGDGFDDVLIGAPTYSLEVPGEGVALLYLGSPTGPAPEPSWIGRSGTKDAALGAWVSTAGDYNGDGFDDIIAGAPGVRDAGTRTGATFIFLGGPEGPSPSPDLTLQVEAAKRLYFGQNVSTAGDVNGDGLDDLLIAVPFLINPNRTAGKLSLFKGRSDLPPGGGDPEAGETTFSGADGSRPQHLGPPCLGTWSGPFTPPPSPPSPPLRASWFRGA